MKILKKDNNIPDSDSNTVTLFYSDIFKLSEKIKRKEHRLI